MVLKDGIEYLLILVLNYDDFWVGFGNGKVMVLRLFKKICLDVNGYVVVEFSKSRFCVICWLDCCKWFGLMMNKINYNIFIDIFKIFGDCYVYIYIFICRYF